MYKLTFLRRKGVVEIEVKSLSAAKNAYSKFRKEDDEKVLFGLRKDYNVSETASIVNESGEIVAERYTLDGNVWRWRKEGFSARLDRLNDADDLSAFDLYAENKDSLLPAWEAALHA